jgi:mono/diheme cytochrome c family protein
MRWLLVASLACLWTAPGLAQPAADPASGRVLAGQLCSGCHLVDPRSQGPVPDGIPSFMAIAARPGIDSARIETTLLSPPHPAMPSPPLDPHQMRDVAAYILSLGP